MACLQSCRQAFENVRLARTILANKDVYPPLVKSNRVFAKPVKSVNNMLLIIEYVSFILSNYKGNLKNGSDKPGFKKVMIIRLMF